MPARLITYGNRNQLPDDNVIPIFNHIPKCGGSTFTKILIHHYGKCLFGISNSRLLNFNEMISRHSGQPACIAGHEAQDTDFLLSSTSCAAYLTFLREPYQLALSNYKYMMYIHRGQTSSLCSPDHYLYSRKKNYLIYFLGGGDRCRAEENLFSNYVFYGLQEYYSESLSRLADLFPWMKNCPYEAVNVSTQTQIEFSKKAIDYFYENNHDDFELYENAVKEFQRRIGYTIAGEQIQSEKPELSRVHYNNEKEPSRPSELIQNVIVNGNREREDEITQNEIDTAQGLIDKELIISFINRLQNPWPSFHFFIFRYYLESGELQKAKDSFAYLINTANTLDSQNQVAFLVDHRLNIIGSVVLYSFLTMTNVFECEKYIPWLQSLRSIKWRAGRAWILEAQILEVLQKRHEAIQCAEKAIETEVYDKLPHYEILCRLLLAEGRLEEAESSAQEELRKNPRSEWALRQLCRTAEACGDMKKAIEAANAALDVNPYWVEGWVALGRCYQISNSPLEALRELEMGFSLFSSSHQLATMLMAAYLEKKELDKAESVAKRMAEQYPNLGYPSYYLSQIYEANGKTDDSISEAEKATQLHPNDMTFRDRYIDILLKHGYLKQAENSAMEGISLYPEKGWPYHQLSRVLETQGNFSESLDQSDQSLKRSPEKRTFASHRASLLRKMNRVEECIDFCKRRLEEDKNQGWAWRELCRCALVCGDQKQAIEYGEEAVKVHPEDSEFRKYFESLSHHAN